MTHKRPCLELKHHGQWFQGRQEVEQILRPTYWSPLVSNTHEPPTNSQEPSSNVAEDA